MSRLIWNKLEGIVGGVVPSEEGADGVIGGTPVFTAAKFGNGLDKPTASNYVGFAISDFSIFELHFWMQPDWASSANPGSRRIITSTPDGLIEVYLNGANTIAVVLYSGAGHGYSPFATYTFTVTWAANELFHFAFLCDNTAADGVRIICKKDKVSQTCASYTGNWLGDTPSSIKLGYSADTNIIYDNFNLYDAILADYSIVDEDELTAPVPTPDNLTASIDTYTDHVATAWDAVAGASPEYDVHRATSSGGSFASVSGWQSGITFDDTTAIPGTDYWYKVKARIGATEGSFSAEAHGRALYVAGPALKYAPITEKTWKVLIGDNEIDIYKLGYVNDLISTVHEKTFNREKLVSDAFSLDVDNADNFFSLDNPISPLHGLPPYQRIQIIDDEGVRIFDGYIEYITRDYNSMTATIQITDALYLWSKTPVTYVSADWETPAAAFKGICAAIGFTAYDSRSVDIADGLFTLAGCYLKINHAADNTALFQQLLEDLGRVSGSDIFSMNGLVVFKHWKVYAETAPFLIVKEDMASFPVVQELTEVMVNDYSIGYDGDSGTPAIDSANGDIGALSRSLCGTHAAEALETSSGDIVLKDLTSAVYLGELFIRRSHMYLSTQPRPVYQIEFDLYLDTGNWIDVDTTFRMTFSDEAWIDKTLEVFRVEKVHDENRIRILAYEVQT